MVTLEGAKVVSAREMVRIERESIAAGASGEEYMLAAAKGVAERLAAFIVENNYPRVITLLAGKGNNGGDAFAAGTLLQRQRFTVQAYHLVPSSEASSLCKKWEQIFIAEGGAVFRGEKVPLEGVLLDGLFGTGLSEELRGPCIEVIQKANESGLPIVSIDIPSGVHGDTGAAEPVAIQATETLYLGLPKQGFFVGEGYNHVGRLFPVDFGLDRKYVEKANGEHYLVARSAISSLLPPLQRVRHKYQAGYVIALAGSTGMAGAAILASLSALRSGAGIVRLFYPREMEQELVAAPIELIKTPYDGEDPTPIFAEAKRAKALLVGPGLGRDPKIGALVQQVASRPDIPIVIDADGLYQIKKFPKGAILTPHTQEMLHLLGGAALDFTSCQAFSDSHQVTIVLKGAPTRVFHPGAPPLIIPKGDPGMATAGTGDVLTGIIAALLAQGLRGREGGVLGAYLHGLAGEIAAEKKTSYSMVASDLIQSLPDSFQRLLGKKN